jgi:hypothetical protein
MESYITSPIVAENDWYRQPSEFLPISRNIYYTVPIPNWEEIQLLIHDPPFKDPGANVNIDPFCGVT